MKKIEIPAYEFGELSTAAQQNALDNMADYDDDDYDPPYYRSINTIAAKYGLGSLFSDLEVDELTNGEYEFYFDEEEAEIGVAEVRALIGDKKDASLTKLANHLEEWQNSIELSFNFKIHKNDLYEDMDLPLEIAPNNKHTRCLLAPLKKILMEIIIAVVRHKDMPIENSTQLFLADGTLITGKYEVMK